MHDRRGDRGRRPRPGPPGFRWLTVGRLADLTRHSGYLNVQARTLLACLRYAQGK
ncbi:NDP-hexose 2,3-dehydratase family protein [Streptomyces lonarensis]|uniref:NDP-hexose 2,3-dehydratase family protein n=1 Tax=Streptomyces lonarensis TaxID=700599 RepID=UPI0028AB5D80|nr:NDP-hexose 2,3-dehydratase family protein [Streptomyces lonarensis]